MFVDKVNYLCDEDMEQKQDVLDQLQQLTAELRGQFFQQLGPELPGLTAMHGRLLLLIARTARQHSATTVGIVKAGQSTNYPVVK